MRRHPRGHDLRERRGQLHALEERREQGLHRLDGSFRGRKRRHDGRQIYRAGERRRERWLRGEKHRLLRRRLGPCVGRGGTGQGRADRAPREGCRGRGEELGHPGHHEGDQGRDGHYLLPRGDQHLLGDHPLHARARLCARRHGLRLRRRGHGHERKRDLRRVGDEGSRAFRDAHRRVEGQGARWRRRQRDELCALRLL